MIPLEVEPLQQTMAAAPIGSPFQDTGIFVKQTARGCLQECIGCTARSEYKISKVAEDWDELLSAGIFHETTSGFPFEVTALEESNCFARNCLKEARPAVIKVSVGEELGGSQVLEFHKPCSFGHGCCCNLPQFTTKLPNGTELNRSRFVWSCCAPYAKFEDPVGTDKFMIHPPLCCFDKCIMPQCSKKGCCTVPFYFYDPVTGEQIEPDKKYPPQIRMVRQGMKKACFTTANNFAVNFPQNLNAEQQAGLLGMTLLIDMVIFEKQAEEQ